MMKAFSVELLFTVKIDLLTEEPRYVVWPCIEFFAQTKGFNSIKTIALKAQSNREIFLHRNERGKKSSCLDCDVT